jgi:hypothetical protein
MPTYKHTNIPTYQHTNIGAGMGFAQFIILGTCGLQWWVGFKLIQAGQLTFPELIAVILTIMFGAVGLGENCMHTAVTARMM